MIEYQRLARLLAMVEYLRPPISVLSAGILWTACAAWAASDFPEFQRTLAVTLRDPVTLDVVVPKGDVTITYNRDWQVSIYASARDANGKTVSMELFASTLSIEQAENHIAIRKLPDPNYSDVALSISYKIDVPLRTEVSSTILGIGRQTVMGITGPAKVVTGSGNINASYIRSSLRATTGKGNISCTRVAQVEAETRAGNITLLEDGPSKAIVKTGPGRIEVGGARGSFEGSTDQGELHIKAVVWDDWQLKTVSGNIRIELPLRANFDADVTTNSGEILIERADMEKPDANARQYRQTVNGGGKQIQVRSDVGRISIE